MATASVRSPTTTTTSYETGSSGGTASASVLSTPNDLPHVRPPPSLQNFADPSLLFIAHVERRSSSNSGLRRVVMVTHQSVVVCTDSGTVKRFIPIENIEKVIMDRTKMAGQNDVVHLLIHVKNEKDLLLSFIPDLRNQQTAKDFLRVVRTLWPHVAQKSHPLPIHEKQGPQELHKLGVFADKANVDAPAAPSGGGGAGGKKGGNRSAEPAQIDVTPPINDKESDSMEAEGEQHVPLHIEQEHELQDIRQSIHAMQTEIERRRIELQRLQQEAVEENSVTPAALLSEIAQYKTLRDSLVSNVERLRLEKETIEKDIQDHENTVGYYNDQIKTQLKMLTETLERERSQRDAYIQMKLLDTEDYYHTLLLRKHDEGDRLREKIARLNNVNESLRVALKNTSKGLHL